MNRLLAHALIVCGTAASLASCTVAAPPTADKKPDGDQAQMFSFSTRQVDLGGSVRFIQCSSDCDKPTPKTVNGARVAAGAATSPVTRRNLQMDMTLPSGDNSPAPPLQVSVAFDRNNAVLSTAEQNRLRAMQTVMQAAAVIRIEGRTDSGGAQAANDHIADARALAVMLFVRDQVLAPEGRRPELHASAKGRCCYIASNKTEQGRRANRRAEVTVEPYVATNAASVAEEPSARQ